jgi:hypothetical protein
MFCAGIARSLDLRNAVRTKPTRRSGASSCWNALHLGDALYRGLASSLQQGVTTNEKDQNE